MSRSLLLLLALATSASSAPLKTEAFTAGPEGFLVTSTLITGEKDAVLIDAQFTLAEAHRLTARLLESRRVLKVIFITHAHPDHYFGLEVLKAAFPEAEVLASPSVAAEIQATAATKLAQWKGMYGANLTSVPVTPRPYAKDFLELEGQRLELVELGAAESESATAVWLPSTRTLIAGDAAYLDVHVWLAETDAVRRATWLKNLEKLKALKPAQVIAGHQASGAAPKEPTAALDGTARYIRDFNAALGASKGVDQLTARMNAKHGRRQLPIILTLAAKAALEPAK